MLDLVHCRCIQRSRWASRAARGRPCFSWTFPRSREEEGKMICWFRRDGRSNAVGFPALGEVVENRFK